MPQPNRFFVAILLVIAAYCGLAAAGQRPDGYVPLSMAEIEDDDTPRYAILDSDDDEPFEESDLEVNGPAQHSHERPRLPRRKKPVHSTARPDKPGAPTRHQEETAIAIAPMPVIAPSQVLQRLDVPAVELQLATDPHATGRRRGPPAV